MIKYVVLNGDVYVRTQPKVYVSFYLWEMFVYAKRTVKNFIRSIL